MSKRIKSESSNRHPNWMIFSTLFFGILTILSSKDIFINSNVNLLGLVTCLFFLCFALASFYYVIQKTEIEISKGKIISKKRFRKKVIHNIRGFKEERSENDNRIGKKLIFKTEKGFFVIDYSYLNYSEISKLAKNNFRKLNDKDFKKYDFQQSLFFRISFLLISFLFFGIFINQQMKTFDQFEKELQTTQITLLANPIIESTIGSSGSNYIRIPVEEYPEFIFKISGNEYVACRKTILTDLKKGDKINIRLKRDDLELKLLKTDEPFFWTTHLHWNKIKIYQLEYENIEYLNFNQLEKIMESDRSLRWFFLLLGLLSFSLVIRKYYIH